MAAAGHMGFPRQMTAPPVYGRPDMYCVNDDGAAESDADSLFADHDGKIEQNYSADTAPRESPYQQPRIKADKGGISESSTAGSDDNAANGPRQQFVPHGQQSNRVSHIQFDSNCSHLSHMSQMSSNSQERVVKQPSHNYLGGGYNQANEGPVVMMPFYLPSNAPGWAPPVMMPPAPRPDEVEGFSTVMMRNLPNKYTQELLLTEVDEAGFRGLFDFLYLPIDVTTNANKGYAFINFSNSQDAVAFKNVFEGVHMTHFDSSKFVSVCPATLQGFDINYAHFSTARCNGGAPETRPLFLREPAGKKMPKKKQPLGLRYKQQQATPVQQHAQVPYESAPANSTARQNQQQPDQKPGEALQANFCPDCGSRAAGFKFCTKCGIVLPSA